MAGERTKLIVTKREHLGSKETRRLRKQGIVPGVLYGREDPIAIAVESRELRRALTGKAGLHSILDVEVDGTGKTHASILKDYQLDKVRGGVTHVDLLEVRLDRPIHASVTVHLIGGEDAPGVREGGVLSQPLRELNVEALPQRLAEHAVTAPMREEEPEEVEGVEGEEGEEAPEGEAEEGAEAGAAPEADASADESSEG